MFAPIQVSCAQCDTKVMDNVAVRSASYYYCSIEHKQAWINSRKSQDSFTRPSYGNGGN